MTGKYNYWMSAPNLNLFSLVFLLTNQILVLYSGVRLFGRSMFLFLCFSLFLYITISLYMIEIDCLDAEKKLNGVFDWVFFLLFHLPLLSDQKC